ncbi:TPA: hypothetical protein I0F65_RS04690 [Enterococcus faecalis]|uniref:hypothetical protein n=1 Tax=Enterococcus faecalis TaxID=1351 RepID=UPI00045A9E78|nr:hypothetical protein [Enterococcus faecalis]KAJ83470.1 hypothetical protein P791_2322 [Enterococcus faecalis NY9]HAP2808249.1 hypothetical protein [Enterococcus faecalis]HBI1635453.1 hypothetical protein [Enterococcus faecalis]HBI1661741.1 hypothetical protein [Enterococcus faecalis]HBI1690485.1 hypothetical protein [Enterococcus faecalis]
MKKKKLGLLLGSIVGIILIASFSVYQYELNREYTIDDAKKLEPFHMNDNPESDESGMLTFNFELGSHISTNKDEKLEYFVFNTKNEKFTELGNDSSGLQYQFDLKEVAQYRIDKFIETGAGQFPYDPERFENLLKDEVANETIYLLVFPKGYALKHDLYNSNDSKFAKENSFESINLNNDWYFDNPQNFHGGYTTVSEYVSSLVTQELSAEDFAYLVTKVRSHVPRPIEIINAMPIETQISKRLEEDYFARGNFDSRKTMYIFPEFLNLATYSPEIDYLRTYSVSESEQEELKDKIDEWNQRIIDDKKKYEEQTDKLFLDENIQAVGKLNNTLFRFRIDEDGEQSMELSVDKENE